jgi:hypothetical protein
MKAGLFLVAASLLAPLAIASDSAVTVHLQTWGAPWTARFDVRLIEGGRLIAELTSQRPEMSQNFSVLLSADEAADLKRLAALAVIEPSLGQGCEHVVDGTSGRLVVNVGGKVLSQECLSTSSWPPAGTLAQELLKRINSRLPKSIQVY